MPKKEVDYSQTIIYKIVCNDLNIKDCYVGHTTDFIKRKNYHKNSCLKEKDSHYNLYVYQIIRANGNWNNWTMIEIEKYPCKDGNEARAKERFWYEELKATLNSIKPLETKEEAIIRHQEHNKKWIEEHKEERTEYEQKYHKTYYQKNKENLNKINKQYNQEHEEEIKKYKTNKITCECGCIVSFGNLSVHKKTQKHIKNLSTSLK